MSQHTPVIDAGQSGLQYRTQDNAGKRAILTHHKGPMAPSYAEAGCVWLDDADTPWVVRMYDGADWIVLYSVHAGTDRAVPVFPAGAVVGCAQDVYATHEALTGVIPHDDTVPQDDEGTEIASLNVTPQAEANLIRVRFSGVGFVTEGARWAGALFVGESADAVAVATAPSGGCLCLEYVFTAGTVSAMDISLRVGPDDGTLYLNGDEHGRLFGGAAAAVLSVEEIQGDA